MLFELTRSRVLAASTAAAVFVACSSDPTGAFGPAAPGSGDPSSPNQPSTELAAFDGAVDYLSSESIAFGAVIDGDGGLRDTAAALEALDLSQPADRAQWASLSATFDAQLADAEQQLAAAVVSAYETAAFESEMQRMRVAALAASDAPPEVNGQQKFVSLATVFVVTTTAITLTRVYRAIRDVSHRNQNRPVRRVATGSEAGRTAIATALRNNGVDVPDDATGEQVADIYEQQSGRYLRANVAQVARDHTQSASGNNDAEAVVATQNMEAQRQDNAQAARDLGVVATDAVVNLSTAGPTGLGAGVEGTMLVLTATENTPNDFVNRHVDAVVASREQQALPATPPSTTDPDDAADRLRRVADGDEDPPTPEEADDLANAIVQRLRDQADEVSPLTTVPTRIGIGSTTLEPSAGSDVRGEVPLPGFTDGESADVLIRAEGLLPQEIGAHALGVATPVRVTRTPLLGTLLLVASPASAAVDGEQAWSAEATITDVHAATQLVFDGVNVSVFPRVVPVSGPGVSSVSVDAFGDATLRVRRLDSGESYLLSLSEEADACGVVGSFTCGGGDVVCADLVCNGSADCADGSDEDGDLCGDESSCCVATQGCPSETGSNCGETCCCCPYGQICDPVDYRNGCVAE